MAEETNPVGRPLQYKTKELLQDAIDEYFNSLKNGEEVDPATVSGLGYHLNLSRQALCEYSEREEFGDTIKRAKQRVEMSLESGILKGYNAAGGIFNLKNNFGWKDKQEIEQTGEQKLNIHISHV